MLIRTLSCFSVAGKQQTLNRRVWPSWISGPLILLLVLSLLTETGCVGGSDWKRLTHQIECTTYSPEVLLPLSRRDTSDASIGIPLLLAFSPDSEILAFVEMNSQGERHGASRIVLFELATRELLTSIPYTENQPRQLLLTSNGVLYAIGQTVRIWNIRRPKEPEEITTDRLGDLDFSGFKPDAVSADGRYLAAVGKFAVGREGEVRVWDLDLGEQIWSQSGDKAHRLKFSPDGELLAILGTSLGLYRTSNGECLARDFGRIPLDIDFTADGRVCVVSFRSESAIAVADLDLGERPALLETRFVTSRGSSVQIHPDGWFLATNPGEFFGNVNVGLMGRGLRDGEIRSIFVESISKTAVTSSDGRWVAGLGFRPFNPDDSITEGSDEPHLLLWDLSRPMDPEARRLRSETLIERCFAGLETDRGDGFPARLGVDSLPDFVPALRQETSVLVRYQAIASIAIHFLDLFPSTPGTIDICALGLEDESSLIRELTARIAGSLGPAAIELAPKLEILLADPFPKVRTAATQALRGVDPERFERAQTEPPTPRKMPSARVVDGQITFDGITVADCVANLARGRDRWIGDYRFSSTKVLASMGEPAIPELLEILKKDGPSSQREAAAKALAVFIYAPTVVGALKAAASVEVDDAVGVAIMETLGDKGGGEYISASDRLKGIDILFAQGESGIPALEAAVDDPAPRVSAAAVKALAKLGPIARDAWIRTLRISEDRQVLLPIFTAIKGLGEEATPDLMQALSDSDGVIRLNALRILVESAGRSPSTSLVTACLHAFEDPKGRVREEALRAIHNFGKTRESVPLFLKRLSDPDPRVRRIAAYSLSSQTDQLVGSGDRFVVALDDPEVSVRVNAALTLVRLNEHSDRVVTVLSEALDSRSERSCALEGLAELLGAGQLTVAQFSEIVPLNAEFIDQSRYISHLARGGPDAVPTLIAFFDSKHRRVAMRTLSRMGSEGERAIPDLVEMISDTDPIIRTDAVFALGRIGVADPTAVATLRGALKDDHYGVRAASAMALGRFGSEARDALPDLESALVDEEEQVRRQAEKAIQVIRKSSSVGDDPDDSAVTTPLGGYVLVMERTQWSGQAVFERAKQSLLRSIGSIGGQVEFAVITYDREISSYPADGVPVLGTEQNRKAAARFVEEVLPGKGAAPHRALQFALEVANRLQAPADRRHILFLSTGRLQHEEMNYPEILDLVAKNNFARVRINVVDMPPGNSGGWLMALARQNQGSYSLGPDDN